MQSGSSQELNLCIRCNRVYQFCGCCSMVEHKSGISCRSTCRGAILLAGEKSVVVVNWHWIMRPEIEEGLSGTTTTIATERRRDFFESDFRSADESCVQLYAPTIACR